MNLFPHLPEQRRPALLPKAPEDLVRCHKCGRKTRRDKAVPEENLLRLVWVCGRC